MTTELGGILTALTTPFTAEGKLDVPALRAHVDRSIGGGVDGVVVCGSTGEFAALTTVERRQAVETVVSHVDGRVPVVAQTGATSTAEAIALSRHAEAAGADVLMPVTPFYEPISLAETTAYLRDVAASVDIPVMIYNIPAATGVNIDASTAGALAREVDNIRYIKDSSANWEQALQLIHHHSEHLGTFIGWDSYIFSALVEGAAGAVAGAASVVPAELASIRRAVASGDIATAREDWRRVYPVIDGLITLPFFAAIKATLRELGAPVGAPRAPVSAIAEDDARRLAALVADLRPNSLA
ncbi:dihydrodipicolinate synthase family protein [Microbacterium karelineae]|uniref:dihydrodipicolinate synthase family protein n=1 Tax=Microbacterium karelineae TaxID=2654283 RepID=UPI0012EACF36|nr:dihydrodipicolinate synthase family protein [Microbacterium karelineae]